MACLYKYHNAIVGCVTGTKYERCTLLRSDQPAYAPVVVIDQNICICLRYLGYKVEFRWRNRTKIHLAIVAFLLSLPPTLFSSFPPSSRLPLRRFLRLPLYEIVIGVVIVALRKTSAARITNIRAHTHARIHTRAFPLARTAVEAIFLRPTSALSWPFPPFLDTLTR